MEGIGSDVGAQEMGGDRGSERAGRRSCIVFQALVNGSSRTDAVSPLCAPTPGGPVVQWRQPVSGMQEGMAFGDPADSDEDKPGRTDPEV